MSDSPTIEDLRQALAAAEAQHGLDHLETAHAAYRLAISRCHDGREGAAEAEILAMRAIDIYEHGPELHRPHLAGPLSMLASFRDRQGRKSEAEAMLRRAIELQWDEENDEDDMCSEDDLQTLGIDLLEQSRYIEAAEFLNRALCVAERTWGVLHPHLRGHLRMLARAYVGLKRFDEAIELMQRELASCIQHFPDEIDARGELLGEIATCQATAGHPEEADECLRKAHELRIQYDKELSRSTVSGRTAILSVSRWTISSNRRTLWPNARTSREPSP